MKFQLILVFVAMTIVNAQVKFNMFKPIVNFDDQPSLSKYKQMAPEERRKLSLFPKNIKKFVVTGNPVENSQLATLRAIITTKRPLMPKITLKNEIEDTSHYYYREPVTRHPLMNIKKFTIGPYNLEIIENYSKVRFFNQVSAEKSSEPFEDENYIDENFSNEDNDADEASEETSSEEIGGEDIISNQNSSNETRSEETKNKEIKSEEIRSEEIIEEIKSEDYEFTTEIDPEIILDLESNRLKRDENDINLNAATDSFTLIEKADLNEFIFMDNNVHEPTDKLKDSIKLDSSEVTTEFVDIDTTKKRVKRIVDVIEEENIGTTISGFKFTGKNSRMTYDLAYKNINS